MKQRVSKLQNNLHGFNVCFLDILGFSSKLEALGLKRMSELYRIMLRVVHGLDQKEKYIKERLHLEESVYWGDNFIFPIYATHAVMASDSILLWCNRTWPEQQQTAHKIIDSALSWQGDYKPVDLFLNVCNELICVSIEQGLPLRGALALGDGVFSPQENIYLGPPICDAVRAEKMQRTIGVGFCRSFFDAQIIPHKYFFDYVEHQKEDRDSSLIVDKVLDWPRHWRNTRSEKSAFDAVSQLDFGNRTDIKNQTYNLMMESEKHKELYESPIDGDLFSQYPMIFNAKQKFSLFLVKNRTGQ